MRGRRHTPPVSGHLSHAEHGETDLKKSVSVQKCILSHRGRLFVGNHFILSRSHKLVFSTVFENIQNGGKL